MYSEVNKKASSGNFANQDNKMTAPISIEIKNLVSQIDKKDWERLCSAEQPYSYQYMLALEASKLDCEFLYAVAFVNNEIVGIAIATMWKLRFPYKLSLKITTMGTPVNTGLALMLEPSANKDSKDRLGKELIDALERESVKRNIHLFVGRDFPYTDYLSDICLDKLYDCAFLKLSWKDFEQYLAQRSYSKRKNIRREMRSLDKAGYRLEVREANVLTNEEAQYVYNSWLQLYYKYNSPDQINLTKDFFMQMSKLNHSVFFLLYNQSKQIIAFDLCFKLGDCLDATYCGVDLDSIGNLSVHKAMLYHIIQYAIDKGFSCINFGISNEEIKVDKLGCHMVTYYARISITPKWLGKLIRPILSRFVLESE